MSGFEREKHLKPLIAGCLALLLIGGILTYNSYQQSLENLERKIAGAQSELTKLQNSLEEYRALDAHLQKLKRESNSTVGRNLITTVEDAAERIDARSQLVYVRPQPDKNHEDLTEEGVEIRLVKLQLHQLVELLHQFEQVGQRLKVTQLRVRTRFDNSELLDTSMILSRFRENR